MDSYQTMCAYYSGVEAYFSVHKVLDSILSSKNRGRERKEEKRNQGVAAAVSAPCPHHHPPD